MFESHGNSEDEHAQALSAAIDQLAGNPPDEPGTVDDAQGLDGFDKAKSQKELIEFVIGLEEKLVYAYEKRCSRSNRRTCCER